MKECRNDSLRINFEFSQNICDCERMDNIWFSGSPDLSAVCFVCKFICLSDGFKTFLVSYVRLDLINQLLVLCCFFSGKIFLFMLFFYIFILMNQELCQSRGRRICMYRLFIQVLIEDCRFGINVLADRSAYILLLRHCLRSVFFDIFIHNILSLAHMPSVYRR